MILMHKAKFLFLSVISLLFCYRIALLNSNEYLLPEHEVAQQELLLSLLFDVINDRQQSKPKSNADEVDQVAIKLNTQLKHHRDMIEKKKLNEQALQKIEREIAIIEDAAKKLNILRLLDHALIAEIKNSIQLLRIQLRMLVYTQREKVNKI